MKPRLRDLLWCPHCHAALELIDAHRDGEEVLRGRLECQVCRRTYPVDEGVPDLRVETGDQAERRVAKTYGYVWARRHQASPACDAGTSSTRLHILRVQDAVPQLPIQGPWAVEVGCGPGHDCAYLSQAYPDIQWVGVDLHASWTALSALARQRSNLHFVQANALALPFRAEQFGFGYSYGVLHHTRDPSQGFGELIRMLQPGGSFAVYVYEAHEDNLWKRLPLRAVEWSRRVTTRLPRRMLYGLCWVASPVVVVCVSWPARLMGVLPMLHPHRHKIPFHFGTGPFSLAADLYDRFGSPIEHRLTRQQLLAWYTQLPVEGQVCHPQDVAGWIGWGLKRPMRMGQGAGVASHANG